MALPPTNATLALDLTCLALGPLAKNPRGIDRVELAYAKHFLNRWPGECVAVIPTLWGVRYFDRAKALRGIAALEAIWRETIQPDTDPAYARARSFLRDEQLETDRPSHPRNKQVREVTRDFWRLLHATHFSFGKAIRSLPQGALYLNVGQLLFWRPTLAWLKARRDIAAVFMIHDLIPVEYPDHHVPLGTKLHRAIMQNASEFADGLIVPSRTVRASFNQEFVPPRLATIPAHAELLPVSSAFLRPERPDPKLVGSLYFMACGAIDAHKNHILLLKVWKELVRQRGQRVPKLILAGFPSVTSQEVFGYIDRNPDLRSSVCIVSGLSTPSLRKLMMSATALLMPSIVEGFGLPVIEALAQRTPVIASDISALREAGAGGRVTFLSPSDVSAWLAAIIAHSDSSETLPSADYTPKTWEDYFTGIEVFLETMQKSA
jgi:glycosyltransferase involved in cell wall biosynthesis